MRSSLEVRQVKFNLSVNPSRADQSWIKGIGSVGGHQNFDVATFFEPVELVYYFQHSSFNIRTFIMARSTNCIDFVEEDYGTLS